MKRKRRKVLAVHLLLSGFLTCLAVGAAVPPQPVQHQQQATARVEYNLAYGTDPAQRMDVYLPANPRKAPVLFMVHGGAWMFGNKSNAAAINNKAAKWGPEGYIVISTDYRLLPDADPYAQAEDVAKALAFAQGKAASWGGDPAKFVLMGHSAGAHLVSLLASDPELAKNKGVKPWLGTISLDSAALDVPQLMKAPHLDFYDKAFGKEPAFWRKVSPTLQLNKAPKPLLMVCSSQRTLSCLQARQFSIKANGLGGHVTVLQVDLSHSEINRNLGLPGTYTDAVNAFLHTLGLP